jgi:hypothetical protein
MHELNHEPERNVTDKKLAPLTDMREVRKLFRAAARGEQRIDGSPIRMVCYAANLLRNAQDLAAYRGFSGEDEMTLIAYQALLAYEKAMDTLLQHVSLNILPHLVFQQQSEESDK